MDKKKANVPKIRFPGFTEVWARCRLGDIAEQTYGGGTPRTSIAEYWNGDIPWIQSSDLVDGKVYGVVPNKKISVQGLGNSAAKLVPKNSIAIITRVGVGKLAFMPFSYATSQDFLSLSRLNIEPWFGVYSCYKKLQSELNVVQGTSIKGITKDELLAKIILVPKFDEQIKIGRFFTCLDKLIALHQRKLNHLQVKKKGLLQKMFPKNGEDVPELRFPGFTDDWEQCKAGDIFFAVSDKNHPELPVLSASQEFGMIKRDESGINISHNKEHEVGYKRVLPGQFVIHLRSFQGGFAYSKIEGITSPAYTVMDFVNKIKYYDCFWKCIFKSESFIKRLELITYGIRDGRSISYNDFATLSFIVPKYQEQKTIGLFFEKFDHLIALHQRKLTHLQEQKKALLQQMFV